MKNPSTLFLPAICILLFVVCSLQSEISFAQNYQWAKGIGSTSGDEGRSVAVNPASDMSNVYITGYFHGTTDLDLGACR